MYISIKLNLHINFVKVTFCDVKAPFSGPGYIIQFVDYGSWFMFSNTILYFSYVYFIIINAVVMVFLFLSVINMVSYSISYF